MDGCDYVLLTHSGCDGRCWFGGFGGRYFTYEDLLVEFNVGEESNEVIGDVDGVVLFYRFLYISKPSPVVAACAEIRGLSVCGFGVIVIWRGKWN